jgi:hypothetical protein
VKALSREECSSWLASFGIAADPYYSASGRSSPFDQFPIAQHAPSASAMFRCIVACAEPFESALLHVIDWSLYEPDEMAVISDVRHAYDERRPLIEAPGHLFAGSERDILVGLLSLVTSYGWSAYLYFDHGVTLLSWEGEIMDLWSIATSHYTAVREVLQHMGISSIETEKG